MALELISRFLAVVLAIAFALVLIRGEIPLVPRGIWTFLALFVVGFSLCTLGGIRDGMGTTVEAPSWLAILNAALGIASMGLLGAVIIGLSWRTSVALLAVATGGSWLASLAYAISAGLSTALLGLVTLAVIVVSVALIAWPGAAPQAPAVRASR